MDWNEGATGRSTGSMPPPTVGIDRREHVVGWRHVHRPAALVRHQRKVLEVTVAVADQFREGRQHQDPAHRIRSEHAGRLAALREGRPVVAHAEALVVERARGDHAAPAETAHAVEALDLQESIGPVLQIARAGRLDPCIREGAQRERFQQEQFRGPAPGARELDDQMSACLGLASELGLLTARAAAHPQIARGARQRLVGPRHLGSRDGRDPARRHVGRERVHPPDQRARHVRSQRAEKLEPVVVGPVAQRGGHADLGSCRPPDPDAEVARRRSERHRRRQALMETAVALAEVHPGPAAQRMHRAHLHDPTVLTHPEHGLRRTDGLGAHQRVAGRPDARFPEADHFGSERPNGSREGRLADSKAGQQHVHGVWSERKRFSQRSFPPAVRGISGVG